MKIFKFKKEILFLTALFISTIIFNGCVASSSFYSGKTLEPKKVAVTFSADDIALKSNDGSVDISKNLPFAPSVGIGIGLPLQLETAFVGIPQDLLNYLYVIKLLQEYLMCLMQVLILIMQDLSVHIHI